MATLGSVDTAGDESPVIPNGGGDERLFVSTAAVQWPAMPCSPRPHWRLPFTAPAPVFYGSRKLPSTSLFRHFQWPSFKIQVEFWLNLLLLKPPFACRFRRETHNAARYTRSSRPRHAARSTCNLHSLSRKIPREWARQTEASLCLIQPCHSDVCFRLIACKAIWLTACARSIRD